MRIFAIADIDMNIIIPIIASLIALVIPCSQLGIILIPIIILNQNRF